MTENAVAISPSKAGEIIEAVIARGDIAQLSAQERAKYYSRVCESIGLNPLTQPFAYITLNGKLTLYARKDATDQLRKIYGVSVVEMAENERDGLIVVTVKVQDAGGRTDMAKGALSIKGLQGEALANAFMKAETKAKRRATLSICGLGFLDETEVADIKRERLPKKDAKDIYVRMQREVDALSNRADLERWQTENAERVAILPEDWEDILRMRIQERRLDIQRAEPALPSPPAVTSTLDEMPEDGEVIWGEPDGFPDATPPEGDSKWEALSPVKQAGILCNEVAFQKFLHEKNNAGLTDKPLTPEDAAYFVRMHCKVKSRAEIKVDNYTGQLWRGLVAEYRAWQRDEIPASPQRGDEAARPASPESNTAQATTGEAADIPIDDLMTDIDIALAEAASKGSDALKEEWETLAPKHQKFFKSALDRRHKPAAAKADQAKQPA